MRKVFLTFRSTIRVSARTRSKAASLWLGNPPLRIRKDNRQRHCLDRKVRATISATISRRLEPYNQWQTCGAAIAGDPVQAL